jgi:hypothetical protein
MYCLHRMSGLTDLLVECIVLQEAGPPFILLVCPALAEPDTSEAATLGYYAVPLRTTAQGWHNWSRMSSLKLPCWGISGSSSTSSSPLRGCSLCSWMGEATLPLLDCNCSSWG